MRLISKLSRICKIYLFLVIVWLCTTMVSHCKILFLIYWLSDLHRTSSQIHEIYVLQRKLFTSINCCFFECLYCALLPFSKQLWLKWRKKHVFCEQKENRQQPVVGAVWPQHQPLLLLQRHQSENRLAPPAKLWYHPPCQATGKLLNTIVILYEVNLL